MGPLLCLSEFFFFCCSFQIFCSRSRFLIGKEAFGIGLPDFRNLFLFNAEDMDYHVVVAYCSYAEVYKGVPLIEKSSKLPCEISGCYSVW